jgi:hypothetical protein
MRPIFIAQVYGKRSTELERGYGDVIFMIIPFIRRLTNNIKKKP